MGKTKLFGYVGKMPRIVLTRKPRCILPPRRAASEEREKYQIRYQSTNYVKTPIPVITNSTFCHLLSSCYQVENYTRSANVHFIEGR